MRLTLSQRPKTTLRAKLRQSVPAVEATWAVAQPASQLQQLGHFAYESQAVNRQLRDQSPV